MSIAIELIRHPKRHTPKRRRDSEKEHSFSFRFDHVGASESRWLFYFRRTNDIKSYTPRIGYTFFLLNCENQISKAFFFVKPNRLRLLLLWITHWEKFEYFFSVVCFTLSDVLKKDGEKERKYITNRFQMQSRNTDCGEREKTRKIDRIKSTSPPNNRSKTKKITWMNNFLI